MKYLYILLFFCVTSCAEDTDKKPVLVAEKNAGPNQPISEVKIKDLANNMITVTGTIIYKNIEGGILGLDGKDGKKYTPHDLDPKYHQPGLVLQITGTIDTDLMSFKQYGPIIKVKSVKVIDDSNIGRYSSEN